MSTSPSAPLVKINTAWGTSTLLLRSVSTSEELGRLFDIAINVLADKAQDITSLLGTKACVGIQLAGPSYRQFHGIVVEAGLEGSVDRRISYRLVLRPWLWLLTRRADTRIFQKKSAQEIIKLVFNNYEHDVAWEVSGEGPKYDYCVQYRETDFNFVSRLLEQEGLYYYFRHTADSHQMVITNKMSAHKPFDGYATIPYRDSADASTDLDTISQWRTHLEVQPGKVTLRDFDFKQPGTLLQSAHNSPRPGAKPALEYYDPPGDYQTQAEGDHYATLRMEEIDARYQRVSGSGNARGIAVGHRFTLKDHVIDSQNVAHVVVSTRIDFSVGGPESGQGDTYFGCSFTAIPASDVFRPQRITPKPTVPGPQTATVVGTAGDEITTDEFGRVKVQFHWDRLGKKDEESSCWIRVSHPLAGKGFGMIALPRIGQEVVVDFLEGDPDRPLITGRVYNGVQTVPYKLPDNKTVATLKSHSTPGGGADNFNELRFEDKKGSEYIWFQAEKNYYQYVKNDAHVLIGNDYFCIIKHDLQEEIKNDVQRTIGKDIKEKIAGNQHLDLTGNSAAKVGGNYGLKVTGDLVLQSDGVVSAKAGADMVQKAGANVAIDAGANLHIKGGANVVIEAGAMLTLKCGGGSVVIGPANVAITGAMVMINSGGGGGSGSGASPKVPEATEPAKKPPEPRDPLA